MALGRFIISITPTELSPLPRHPSTTALISLHPDLCPGSCPPHPSHLLPPSAMTVPSAAVQNLTSALQAAFAAERRRGEAISYEEQSPESFSRLDAAVRAAVQDFQRAPGGGLEGVGHFLNWNSTHYTRNAILETEDFELMVGPGRLVQRY